LEPATTYYWQVYAVNGFGETESRSGWASFTTAEVKTGAHLSSPAQDGWMLEASEFGNIGKAVSKAGKLRVGDDAANRQYRSLLSFNTAGIPDNAFITNVKLSVYRYSTPAPDISASFGNLVADMKKGFFGTSAALVKGDFSAAGERINTAGTFRAAGGNWYELTLNPLYFKYINVKSSTQFRIRFAKDDNNDRKTDIIEFDSGEGAHKPQLVINYTIP
jgi:hypothetical protein